MNVLSTPGPIVRGELMSASILATAAIPLYDTEGAVRPVAASERLVITDVVIFAEGMTGGIDVFNDPDGDDVVDPGERIASVYFGGGSNASSHQAFVTPFVCKKGAAPIKAKASAAGNVRILVKGFILPNGDKIV